MPQLIAMIIVVVGALIYMFQTFGGTGDKVEGIAQKTSILTEINNIKDGIKIAARSEAIEAAADGTKDTVKTLEGLAEMAYFAEQINEQINADLTTKLDTVNVYNAISFGGTSGDTAPAMQISLVANQGMIPGIFVDLTQGSLSGNAAFLEAQISSDLSAIAYIDRKAEVVGDAGTVASGSTGIDSRIPVDKTGTKGTTSDGKFIIYFKDFASNEVVK